MAKISRRSLVKILGITTGAATISIRGLLTQREELSDESRKLKLLVVRAHTDDPETNCGGIISLFSNNGHEIVVAYRTKGEAVIRGKTHEEAIEMRTAEAFVSHPQNPGRVSLNTFGRA